MAEAKWYVVHTYSGYENKVKANIDKTIENRHLEDEILEVRVPMQEVVELKNGVQKASQKKMFPGYVLIHMIMNDDTWYVVRTYTYQGNPVGKAAVTLSDEYLQKDNTENEAQVSGDKSDSETQKQVQSTIPREVILVICVIAAVLILIIVWRAVLKHLRKKKVETNRKRRREVDKD